jgi:hypothetical protein
VEKWQTTRAIGTATEAEQKNRDFENPVIFQATRPSLKKRDPQLSAPISQWVWPLTVQCLNFQLQKSSRIIKMLTRYRNASFDHMGKLMEVQYQPN